MEVTAMDTQSSKPSHVTMIMDLPRVIMVEILSRLPIKSIFCCKMICKLWYNLLTSDSLFFNMYQTRSPNFSCILLLDANYKQSLLELEADYNYYSCPYNRPIMLSAKFHFPPVRVFLIGSCNGLICLLNGSMHTDKDTVYISNPLVGEYFKLKLPETEKSVCHVSYGFCFSKVSGEYKVLRLIIRNVQDDVKVSELEVYTLGVHENWRNVGEIPCPAWYNFGNANVNGALHWMDSENNDSIYSFDIETEKIKSLPTPPGLETPSSCLRLAELGNYLCLTDYTDRRDVEYLQDVKVDIWWMKEYGIAESWTKHRISVDSFPPGMINYNFEPILIWKDGEILIQSHRVLVSYNPEKKKFRVVDVYDDVAKATRYTPSFYSLKTIMGDNFQVTNVYPKSKIV